MNSNAHIPFNREHPGTDCGCKSTSEPLQEPTGREQLGRLIIGMAIIRQQLQAFRDLLPVDSETMSLPAQQGMKIVAKMFPENIESDLRGIEQAEHNLTMLLQALPAKFASPNADRGLTALVANYQYQLSRRF